LQAQELTQSVRPDATRMPVATSKSPLTIAHARKGHAAMRAMVSAFGSVYGDSCSSASSFFLPGFWCQRTPEEAHL
jgi:hypothetical protein